MSLRLHLLQALSYALHCFSVPVYDTRMTTCATLSINALEKEVAGAGSWLLQKSVSMGVEFVPPYACLGRVINDSGEYYCGLLGLDNPP